MRLLSSDQPTMRTAEIRYSGPARVKQPAPERPRALRFDAQKRAAKKLLRSLQVHFPFILEAKFAAMRSYRNALRIPFEPDFRALRLFPESRNGGVFLDVGANRGQSTDAIAMFAEAATIHLFEPNPILFGQLARRFAQRERLRLHNVGLADVAHRSTLMVPVYKKWAFDGLGSFERAEAAEWLRSRLYFYRESHLTLRTFACTIVRLDELQLLPFFVKLDIQGYELKALQGGVDTLQSNEPVLLIESPSDEIISFLHSLGYEFYAFVAGRFVQRAVGAPNTFFMTPKYARSVRHYIESRPDGPIVRL